MADSRSLRLLLLHLQNLYRKGSQHANHILPPVQAKGRTTSYQREDALQQRIDGFFSAEYRAFEHRSLKSSEEVLLRLAQPRTLRRAVACPFRNRWFRRLRQSADADWLQGIVFKLKRTIKLHKRTLEIHRCKSASAHLKVWALSTVIFSESPREAVTNMQVH